MKHINGITVVGAPHSHYRYLHPKMICKACLKKQPKTVKYTFATVLRNTHIVTFGQCNVCETKEAHCKIVERVTVKPVKIHLA